MKSSTLLKHCSNVLRASLPAEETGMPFLRGGVSEVRYSALATLIISWILHSSSARRLCCQRALRMPLMPALTLSNAPERLVTPAPIAFATGGATTAAAICKRLPRAQLGFPLGAGSAQGAWAALPMSHQPQQTSILVPSAAAPACHGLPKLCQMPTWMWSRGNRYCEPPAGN